MDFLSKWRVVPFFFLLLSLGLHGLAACFLALFLPQEVYVKPLEGTVLQLSIRSASYQQQESISAVASPLRAKAKKHLSPSLSGKKKSTDQQSSAVEEKLAMGEVNTLQPETSNNELLRGDGFLEASKLQDLVLSYPQRSIENQEEGVVVIKVARDAAVSRQARFTIETSSSYSRLDNVALAALQNYPREKLLVYAPVLVRFSFFLRY